jgi:tetratricopeptide (TPR) repeat protein
MRGAFSVGRLVAVWCVSAVAVCGQAPTAAKKAATAEDFDKSWKALVASTQRGEWKTAKKRIESLLEEHREAPYVRAKRDDVVLVHKTASFREKTPVPDPKKLVSGKLTVWEPLSGRLKIEYGPESMGDWKKRSKEGSDTYDHPAVFVGPHSIEIKVKRYPTAGQSAPVPGVMVCSNDKSAIRATFGLAQKVVGDYTYGLPAALERFVGERESPDELAKDAGAALAGGPVTLKVTVADTSVTMSTGTKQLLTARKNRDEWGGVLFWSLSELERVVLEGKVEPSWIQGLADAADAEARALFDTGYVPEASGLPTWLFEAAKAPKAAADGPSADPDALPDDLTDEQETLTSKLGREPAVFRRQKLEALTDAQLPAATRFLLLGEARLAYEDYVGAVVDLRAAAKAAPNNVRVLVAFADALCFTGEYEDAADAASKAFAAAPRAGDVGALAARYLFLAGRPEEAKRAREAAIAAGARSKRLDELGPILAKAAHGPDWTRRESVQSDHYEITTDIDRTTASEAAKVLEESYGAYVNLLGRPKGKAPRARVFLFSGEEGYRRYADDVTGDAPMQTAGMYSPVLKQLLIWNLPTREAMFKTVRHEGLHQFLDRQMRDPPIWLNEGLAEYFETVRVVNGSWKKGEVRKDHVPVLVGAAPLEKFLRIDHADFYKGAEANYPQAWSVVHFLLHGTPESKKIYDALYKKLTNGASASAAVDEIFTPEVMSWFQPSYTAHLLKLRAG